MPAFVLIHSEMLVKCCYLFSMKCYKILLNCAAWRFCERSFLNVPLTNFVSYSCLLYFWCVMDHKTSSGFVTSTTHKEVLYGILKENYIKGRRMGHYLMVSILHKTITCSLKKGQTRANIRPTTLPVCKRVSDADDRVKIINFFQRY